MARLGALLDRMGQGADAGDDAAVLDDLPIARLGDLIDAPEAVLRMLSTRCGCGLCSTAAPVRPTAPSPSRTTR